MICAEHKNEEVANCPSCLAEYWKEQYWKQKAENARLRALLTEAIDACDAPFEFGTDLYKAMLAAARSGGINIDDYSLLINSG